MKGTSLRESDEFLLVEPPHRDGPGIRRAEMLAPFRAVRVDTLPQTSSCASRSLESIAVPVAVPRR
jgi:hypothetical protein